MAADFLVASVEKETNPLFRNRNDLIMVCVHEVIRAASGGRLFVACNGVRVDSSGGKTYSLVLLCG